MKPSRTVLSCGFVAGLIAVASFSSAQVRFRPPPPGVLRTPRNIGRIKPRRPKPIAGAKKTGTGFPKSLPPPPRPGAPFKPVASGQAAPTPPPTTARNPAGGVTIGLQEADLPELVNWIGALTGRRFIYGSKVRKIKVTLFSPTPVSVHEAYRAFLVALETNGLTVLPHGRFLKIVETTGGVARRKTPIYGTGSPVPSEDRYITRLYRLQHVSAQEVNALLAKFKTKNGDVTIYPAGNLLILTDTGANIRRMLRIVEEVDVGSAGNQIYVEPVHYGDAKEFAKQLSDVFGLSGGKGGKGGKGGDGTKILAEDRTNSLVIVATEPTYLRILEFVKRIDVPQTGDGQIHVLALQHAMAEELAPVLAQIVGSSGGNSRSRGRGRRGRRGGNTNTGGSGVLEGGVRITADKSTNSLIITSSLRDYAQIRRVISKLDMPRRQVFIEAVIMDMTVDHSTNLGVKFHGGASENIGGPGNTLFYGGNDPLTTIGVPTPDTLNGLALGVRGPGLGGTENLLGIGVSIPAFGVVMNALANNSDTNVLATPHIIATDNVSAEINVGQNIPLQGSGIGALGGLAGLAGLGGNTTGGASALGGLGALGGGLGGGRRQDVGTKIKVTPHMNDSNEVRLELEMEYSEPGPVTPGNLNAVSIVKRTANTSVIVGDQQTVVIGGLMRDTDIKGVKKVPLLGDIPVLGFLFREKSVRKQKVNLLLVLTPYVIRNQGDLKAVFERKMQERQQFLDRYFVFSDQKNYEVPKDFSRLNGLLEEIRQSFIAFDDERKLAEATKPRAMKLHEPGQPIEMPDIVRSKGTLTPRPPRPSNNKRRPPKIKRPRRTKAPVLRNIPPRILNSGVRRR